MWNNLKASIASVVRTNNNQEITGANLQSVLNTIVNSIGANAMFAGVATPSTSPGTPDGPVFWIAGPGTYSNFGQLTVVGDVLGVFVWSDSAWHYDSVITVSDIYNNLNIDDEPTAGSDNLVKSGGVAGRLTAIGYFVCDTAAATAAKTIAATGYTLTTGGNIRIKMTNANTADAVTLNINSTGAKALFYNGEQASSTNSWEAGEVIEVYYDGTQFQCQANKGGDNSGIIQKINPIIYYTGHITQNDRNVTFSAGDIYLQLSDGSTTFIRLSQDTTFLINNNDTHICFNLITRQLELVYYSSIDFYTQIPLISFDSDAGGIMPTSLMYDYILRDEVRQLPSQSQLKLNLITRYSTYNAAQNTCQFNIKYDEGRIEWSAGTFMLYTNDGQTIEDRLQAGYSEFIDNNPISPKTYVRFIYFNRTDKTFNCVEYSLKNSYLSGNSNKDLYLIACGTFNNPEATMYAGGIFAIDGVVYTNYISVNNIPDPNNKLKNKKISILGDSISTYQGYLASDAPGYDGAAYAYWYPRGNVQNVNDTWWKKLINETEMILVKNCAWSDSECQGNSEATATAQAGCSDRRISDLKDGNIIPDIIIVYIGVNDWGHGKSLGTFSDSDLIPNEGVITNFANAYTIMVDKIQRTYPTTKLFCCTLLNTGYTNYDTSGPGSYPAINRNDITLNAFNNIIIDIVNNLGATLIDLRKCGFNFHNFTEYTIGDNLHPNIAGMELLEKYIKNQLELLY